MKKLLLILLAISAQSHTKEDCDLEAIGLNEKSELAERYFFSGTCHYRNEDYQLAVEHWEKLSKLKQVPAEFEELQIDVLNNLGYMKFFGYGTEKNQKQAMQLWKEAILMGHEEAEYHLCHAYADKDESTYDLAKGRKHCKKAMLIYKGMEQKDNEILEQIEGYLSELGAYQSP